MATSIDKAAAKQTLSDEAQATIRERAEKIFRDLQTELEVELDVKDDDQQHEEVYHSWIRGPYSYAIERGAGGKDNDNDDHNNKFNSLCPDDHEHVYPSRRCRYFDKFGFAHVPSFAQPSEVRAMKDQMQALVEDEWDPEHMDKPTIFRTDEKQITEQGSDDYFLTSSNKVHFFAESGAIDIDIDEQNKSTNNKRLKQQFVHDKISALNKAGHGMHVRPGAFHDYTTSSKIQNLVTELGWIDPIVPQSMYIFKQAFVGSEVTSHQDSTFLYTTPKQSCLGLWLALDDATITNGCLWVRPKSHGEKTRRKFVRNPVHFGTEQIEQRSNDAKGDVSASQMIFEDEPNTTPIAWEGKIPDPQQEEEQWESLFRTGFVPVECKAGDLVVFPGELDHLSLANTTDQQRHTFQLHMVEGEGAGVRWSETNWLQYPKGVPFLRIL